MTDNSKSLEGKELVDRCATLLFERKVEELIWIRLEEISQVADSYIVGTCKSEAQMRAVMSALQRQLRKDGLRPVGVDFKAGVRWAVLDMGEIMVHLFEENYREEVSLERLWGDGTQIPLNIEDYEINLQEDEEDDDGLL